MEERVYVEQEGGGRCSSVGGGGWSPELLGWMGGVRGLGERRGAHVSHPVLSVLSRERDLVLCGDAGLGGLLKVELLEAVE